MSPVDWVKAFGGLGLLLFSLRFLTSTLNESVSSRFRPILDRLLSSPVRCVTFGVAAATLFQASSVVIVAAMGLVDSALISLEQSFLLMLGATVGTTFKMWFLAGPIQFGPILIGIGSLSLLFIRNPLLREFMKIATAVGFTFLGLDMLAQSMAPIRHSTEFTELLRSNPATSLGPQLVMVLIGATLTAVIQSGSAMVALVIGLAVQGVIGFQSGAALVLGANIGTASIGLLASLQSSRDGRRLAVSHLLAKLGGVLLTLFFFPSFLAMVTVVTGWFVSNAPVALLLAAVHTAFNVINTLWWFAFSGLFLSMIRRMLPGEDKRSLGLPKGVRRLLNNAPKRAVREITAQFQQMEMLVKSLYDHTLTDLAEGKHSPTLRARRVWLERSLSNLKETLHDLLFALSRQPGFEGEHKRIRTLLATMEIYSGLTRTCYAFNDHLERGFVVDGFEIPQSVGMSLKELQNLLDGLWLGVLRPDQADNQETLPTPEQPLEEVVLEHVRKVGSGHQEYLTWLFEIAGYLRTIARHLGEIQQLKLRQDVDPPEPVAIRPESFPIEVPTN